MLKDYIRYATPNRISTPYRKILKLESLDVPKNKQHTFGAGIEIEVEGIQAPLDLGHEGWAIHNDGSLRNGGLEAVTWALREDEVVPILNIFATEISKHTHHSFSERTSVHVHLDCSNFTTQDLAALLLVYVTVERLLFNYAGGERFGSIYCVPSCVGMAHHIFPLLLNTPESEFVELHATILSRVFGRHYAALNVDNLILPTRSQGGRPYGTVEFRHMKGNADVTFIKQWVEILERLKIYAVTSGIEKIRGWLKDLNTTSYYREYLSEIFGPLAPVLIRNTQLQTITKELSQNVSIAKTWFVQHPPLNSVKFLKTSLAKRLQGTLFGSPEERPPIQQERDAAEWRRWEGPAVEIAPVSLHGGGVGLIVDDPHPEDESLEQREQRLRDREFDRDTAGFEAVLWGGRR